MTDFMSVPRTINGKRTPEFAAYAGMLQRCGIYKGASERNIRDYCNRGIVVGNEFLGRRGFDNFFNHIGSKPSPDMLLDRINNDESYVYGNIKWSTPKESANNRRCVTHRDKPPGPPPKLYTFNSKSLSIMQWSKEYGIPYYVFSTWLPRGTSIEHILRVYGKIK